MTRIVKLPYQQGVILVVALIMLLVMTLIGVTLMSGSTLQERMAGNNRQLSLARINAEGALREAETYLDGLNIVAPGNIPRDVIAANFHGADDGKYIEVIENEYPQYEGNFDPLAYDMSDPANWNNPASVPYISATATTTTAQAPRYVIEYIGRFSHGSPDIDVDVSEENKDLVATTPFVFQITAIGYGTDSNISAILQSTYTTSN